MLSTVQLFFIENKKAIVRFVKLFWILLIILFITTIQIKELQFLWKDLGKWAATTSIISFWLSLTPGIMKRLGVNKPPIVLFSRTILMLFRREIGVNMYVFASIHFGWSRILPVLAVGGSLLDVSPFEIMGFLSFALLTPLFLTSNDYSQKKLFKKSWPTLHKLARIIIWTLFIHIALNEAGIKAFITFIIAILVITSLIIDRKKKRSNRRSSIEKKPQAQA